MKSITGVAIVLVGLMFSVRIHASPPPDYDFDWATIGAPGNRGTTQEEAPGLSGWSIGSVAYEYRISTTEVTVGQWYEFVRAYAPYYTGSSTNPAFSSWWIKETSSGYVIDAGAEKWPANMSWHYAARYVNWLHNGKSPERWAFEDGVYDTSTFTLNPDGSRADQVTHDSGARFWIPTLDEWTKAVYYDADRYGAGSEGYWLQPDGGVDPLISGPPPDLGGTGETSGGYPETDHPFDVGSYPDVKSPWGLLDASGGVSEWTGTVAWDGARPRWLRGSSWLDLESYSTWDQVDFIKIQGATLSTGGLRIASAVPSPPSVFPACLLLTAILRLRREDEK